MCAGAQTDTCAQARTFFWNVLCRLSKVGAQARIILLWQRHQRENMCRENIHTKNLNARNCQKTMPVLLEYWRMLEYLHTCVYSSVFYLHQYKKIKEENKSVRGCANVYVHVCVFKCVFSQSFFFFFFFFTFS